MIRERIRTRSPSERAAHGNELLSRVEKIITDTEEIVTLARSSKDLRAAVSALNALTKQIELVGKLSGGLPSGALTLNLTSNTSTTINLGDDDKELAICVGEATHGFDVAELLRLKSIAESTPIPV